MTTGVEALGASERGSVADRGDHLISEVIAHAREHFRQHLKGMDARFLSEFRELYRVKLRGGLPRHEYVAACEVATEMLKEMGAE